MPVKRPITKAAYIEHADSYAVRPRVAGRQYFLGYWPTEAQAIKAGNDFKALAARDQDPAFLQQAAAEIRRVAQDQRDNERDAKADRRSEVQALKQGRMRVRTILEKHEREIDELRREIFALRNRIGA